MSLDVYIVDKPHREALSGEPPACSFEEPVHAFLFHGAGIDVYSRYPFLRRMIDFYADASFTGDALTAVVTEIDDFLPQLSGQSAATEALILFRNTCLDAHAARKSVFLYCD